MVLFCNISTLESVQEKTFLGITTDNAAVTRHDVNDGF